MYPIALSYKVTRGGLALRRALQAGFHFEERLQESRDGPYLLLLTSQIKGGQRHDSFITRTEKVFAAMEQRDGVSLYVAKSSWRGSEQPDLVIDVPAYCRGTGLDDP